MSDKPWSVTFVGDYFSLVTHVEIEDRGTEEEQYDTAVALAKNILRHHYGWEMDELATVWIEAVAG